MRFNQRIGPWVGAMIMMILIVVIVVMIMNLVLIQGQKEEKELIVEIPNQTVEEMQDRGIVSTPTPKPTPRYTDIGVCSAKISNFTDYEKITVLSPREILVALGLSSEEINQVLSMEGSGVKVYTGTAEVAVYQKNGQAETCRNVEIQSRTPIDATRYQLGEMLYVFSLDDGKVWTKGETPFFHTFVKSSDNDGSSSSDGGGGDDGGPSGDPAP